MDAYFANGPGGQYVYVIEEQVVVARRLWSRRPRQAIRPTLHRWCTILADSVSGREFDLEVRLIPQAPFLIDEVLFTER